MILLIPLLITLFIRPIIHYIVMPGVLHFIGFFVHPVGRTISGLFVLGFVALCGLSVVGMVVDTVTTCATYGCTIEERAAYTLSHPDDPTNPYDTDGHLKKNAPRSSTTFSDYDWKTKSSVERTLERIDENGRPL